MRVTAAADFSANRLLATPDRIRRRPLTKTNHPKYAVDMDTPSAAASGKRMGANSIHKKSSGRYGRARPPVAMTQPAVHAGKPRAQSGIAFVGDRIYGVAIAAVRTGQPQAVRSHHAGAVGTDFGKRRRFGRNGHRRHRPGVAVVANAGTVQSGGRVLYVVRRGHHSREWDTRAVRLLEEAGATMLGVVFNGSDRFRLPC